MPDERDDSFDNLIHREACGVEADGVRGRLEGRHKTRLVVAVPRQLIRQD
jgi:hypothetical protein